MFTKFNGKYIKINDAFLTIVDHSSEEVWDIESHTELLDLASIYTDAVDSDKSIFIFRHSERYDSGWTSNPGDTYIPDTSTLNEGARALTQAGFTYAENIGAKLPYNHKYTAANTLYLATNCTDGDRTVNTAKFISKGRSGDISIVPDVSNESVYKSPWGSFDSWSATTDFALNTTYSNLATVAKNIVNSIKSWMGTTYSNCICVTHDSAIIPLLQWASLQQLITLDFQQYEHWCAYLDGVAIMIKGNKNIVKPFYSISNYASSNGAVAEAIPTGKNGYHGIVKGYNNILYRDTDL